MTTTHGYADPPPPTGPYTFDRHHGPGQLDVAFDDAALRRVPLRPAHRTRCGTAFLFRRCQTMKLWATRDRGGRPGQ
jgi:hypothetical protein